MHKYSCEFGLGVYCSYKTIIPVEELETMKKSKRYHIYSILSTAKISIDKDDINIGSKGVSFNLIKHCGEHDEKFEIQEVDILGLGFDYQFVKISTKYPYQKMKIEVDKTYLLQFYEANIKGKYQMNKSQILEYKNISIDSQRLFYNFYTGEKPNNEMQVLYVGQAFGLNGERTALDRLKSHEKLQKILIDCNSKYPHKRIYILLMQMNTQIFSGFNGISKEFMRSEEESDKHLNDVMSSLPKEKQIINITEDAIINYFKPEYNTNFVNNFPSVKHKGYSQYYDLDYNSITVELDMTFDHTPYLQLYTDENRLDTLFETIKYNLFNDPNRSDMNDIFEKNNIVTK